MWTISWFSPLLLDLSHSTRFVENHRLLHLLCTGSPKYSQPQELSLGHLWATSPLPPRPRDCSASFISMLRSLFYWRGRGSELPTKTLWLKLANESLPLYKLKLWYPKEEQSISQNLGQMAKLAPRPSHPYCHNGRLWNPHCITTLHFALVTMYGTITPNLQDWYLYRMYCYTA